MLLLTVNAHVEASVTSCTWNQFHVNCGVASMDTARKGRFSPVVISSNAFCALMLLVGRQEGHLACKNWMVVCCLERGADLHMAQLMPLPLTVSCLVKSRLVLPFWYRLTWVVLERGPLNGCVYVYLIKNMKFLLCGGSHKGATGFCVWGTSLWSIPPPFLWTCAYLSVIISWCPLLQPLHQHIQLDLLAITEGVYLLALKQHSTWYFDISVKCANSP